MAWRPHEQLIEGELTNRIPGFVTGHLLFRGMDAPVILILEGNFHRDIRGATIRLRRAADSGDLTADRDYMEGFAQFQSGKAGDITAGMEPADYVDYPYIEWYSNKNGRVVLELEPNQVTVVGKPLPPEFEKPNDPAESREKFLQFLAGLSSSLTGQRH